MVNRLFSIILIIALLTPSLGYLSKGEIEQENQSLSSDDIIDMINQVDDSLLYYYLERLLRISSRFTGTINCIIAGQQIFDEFEKMGLDVEFHYWKFAGFNSRNVVATLPGSDPSSTAEYLITAHYDTVRVAPGANDDGSGVAAVLAIASILSQYSFNHTIRFITFSGEEVGTYGSFCYARDAYRSGDNIVAVLNADMIGYADTSEGGNILRFFPPDRSLWIFDYADEISEKYFDNIELSVELMPHYIGSDHKAFVDYGYDAVWIAHHDEYPWGHSAEDTLEHINFTYEVKATKLLLAILAELGLKSIDIQVVLKAPFEGRGYFFNRPIIKLDLGKLWYRELRGVTLILGRADAVAEVYSKEDIEYVVFCIDNNFMYWDSTPPYEWKIEGKHSFLLGKYLLRVYVYTKTGKIAVDEMDMRIFTLSYQYG